MAEGKNQSILTGSQMDSTSINDRNCSRYVENDALLLHHPMATIQLPVYALTQTPLQLSRPPRPLLSNSGSSITHPQVSALEQLLLQKRQQQMDRQHVMLVLERQQQQVDFQLQAMLRQQQQQQQRVMPINGTLSRSMEHQNPGPTAGTYHFNQSNSGAFDASALMPPQRASTKSTGSNSLPFQIQIPLMRSPVSSFSSSPARIENTVQIKDAKTSEETPEDFAKNGVMAPWSETSAGLFARMTNEPGHSKSKEGKTSKRDTKGRPKRPLSAYNLYFQNERANLLREASAKVGCHGQGADKAHSGSKRKSAGQGKIGFETLAKTIGPKWRALGEEERALYKAKADEDMERYRNEMEQYKNKKQRQV